MTGGRVVVIGKTGKNFAAGMSGGVAYVLDEERDLYTKLNKEMVLFSEVTEKYDIIELKTLIEEHVAATGSQRGKKSLITLTSIFRNSRRLFRTTTRE